VYKYLFACGFLLISICAIAQKTRTVEGTIRDSTGRPIVAIALRLHGNVDTFSVLTDINGRYHFSHVNSGNFWLEAAYNDSVLYSRSYVIPANDKPTFIVPPIVVHLRSQSLDEVIVRPPPVTIMEDTIQFNAAAFQVREGAVVEELIKKFPGLTVDRDGNVTAQGKPVTKVRVNGKDFFAGDILTATQNLPADIVRNIQIIDDYGEQANLTGIKTGEPQKVININTLRDKQSGTVGNIIAGIGTDGRYLANMSLNRFNNEKQVSLIATVNNTNVNANAFGGSGRNNPPLAGGSAGIATTYALGLNFRNNWGKKLVAYGSYSFSSRENYTEGLTYQQDLNPLNTRTTSRTSTNTSVGNSHKLNGNMEYAISAASFLKLSANVSYANTSSSGTGVSTINDTRFFTDSRNVNNALGDNSSVGANTVFNHKFDKKGRNLNVNGAIDYGLPLQHTRVDNLLTDIDSAGADSLFQVPLVTTKYQRQRQEMDNGRLNTRFNISYMEPLKENVTAELSYSLSYENTINKREVFDLDLGTGYEVVNSGLSNNYHSTFLSSRYSFSIQSRQKNYNYLIGIVAQPSELNGFNHSRNQETHYTNTNWLPTARFMYRFTRSQTLTINYNGSYSEPDFQKLQPIADSANPSNVIVGNPNLKPEFTNKLSAAYNASNKETGSALFANLSYDKTLNRIVNNVFNDPRSTSRTITYLNANGFYHLSGNITCSQPFSSRKYVVTAGIRGNFDNNISFSDNQRSNGQNWIMQPNAKVLIDLPNILDAELNAAYTINRTNARYPGHTITTETRTFTLGLSGRIFFFKNLSLGYDYSKSWNYGYGGATNINPDILSVFLEYRFMKQRKATVRLQGFDLLNQNSRITRTISGTTIVDNRSNGLQRYYRFGA